MDKQAQELIHATAALVEGEARKSERAGLERTADATRSQAMNELKYVYITKHSVAFGEVCVEGHTADGRLLFGFRVLDSVFWQARARRYVPLAYIPVFQANRPVELRA